MQRRAEPFIMRSKGESMKRKFSLGVAALAFVFSTLVSGSAHAATGCFPDTNGHWAETFVCWMKDSGITAGYGDGTFRPENSITRAETSVFLKKVADLQDSKTSGLILVSAGFGDWKPFTSTANLSYTYFSSLTRVQKATTGSEYLSIHPSIPTVLYGKSLQLVGVEFCYTAAAGTSLTYVEINKTTATSNAGGRTLLFS
ncbi:S-layer homology domain-containing protein, partial [bacterium]|nr:S-layer homology domain-containing protein [bacterium]